MCSGGWRQCCRCGTVLGMTTPTTDITPDSAASEERWIPDDSSFGARLVLIRQRMRWSNVAEAARACGLDRESWRLWEQGRTPSRLVTVAIAIATASKCDLDWLIRGRSVVGVRLNERYPLTVADLVAEPVPAALRARLVERVKHGDGRRKAARPISGVPVARAVNPGRPTRHKDRPVSRIAAA